MKNPEAYFLDHIRTMPAYVPGEQPRQGGFIKLNTNENPYPPAPLVLERLLQACDASLRTYPDPEAKNVRSRLGELFGVTPESTLVGNGSDELLNIILRSFVAPGDRVAYPYPTYGYYDTLSAIQGAQTVKIDFPPDYSLPPSLAEAEAKVTFVANPNAPSGTLIATEVLDRLAARLPGLLVIDEAYVDFSDGGSIDLAQRHNNVIVLRTMSKSYSLAGMRLGFCFASPVLIAGMAKVKDHYNVNRLSLVAAEAALEANEYMQANARRIATTRTRLRQALLGFGFEVPDSAANFVLARIDAPPAQELYRQLKERRILVRHFSQPRLNDCLRISVGTDQEIDILLEALDLILADQAPATANS
jgi:histidinol-phosphate aminotransferase